MKPTYKPGSVVDDHLSRLGIATELKRLAIQSGPLFI